LVTVFVKNSPERPPMLDPFDVLVVSTRAEDRKALMQVLDKLSANVLRVSQV